jgi:TM2 domain-containing membrane protein YozV
MLHRFYLGKPISALVQIFTGGGLLIWFFIDIYQIVKCEIKDSNGNEIE